MKTKKIISHILVCAMFFSIFYGLGITNKPLTASAATTGVVTVIYNGNGHTGGSVPTSQSVTTPGPVPIKSPGTMVKTGYIFAGWSSSSGSIYLPGGSYAYSTVTNCTFNLYAIWSINKTLDIKGEQQKGAYWCWAAIAYMMRQYEKSTEFSQSQIVNAYKIDTYGSGNQESIVKALKHGNNVKFSGAAYKNISNSNFDTEVVSRILNGKPVQVACMPVNTSLTLGHSYLIIGISNNDVGMIDPSTGNRKTISRSVLFSGFQCDAFTDKRQVYARSIVYY